MAAWKKYLLICIAFAALATPGALPSRPGQAEAGHGHAQVRYYYIYYRSSPWDSWHYYGATTNPQVAAYYVNWFHHNRYDAFYW